MILESVLAPSIIGSLAVAAGLHGHVGIIPRQNFTANLYSAMSAPVAATAAVPAVAPTPAVLRSQRMSQRLIEPKSKKYVGPVELRDFKWQPFESVLKALDWDIENGAHVITMTPGRTVIKTDARVESSEYESRVVYFADGSKPELQLKVMLNLNSDDFSF